MCAFLEIIQWTLFFCFAIKRIVGRKCVDKRPTRELEIPLFQLSSKRSRCPVGSFFIHNFNVLSSQRV